MENDYTEKLKKHIEVLEKGYDNLVLVLGEDVEMEEDEEGNKSVKLKDDKIKTYADGIDKASDALDKQLGRIKSKKEELKKLQEADGESVETAKKPRSNQNKHLK
tara:strand:+ start:1989 stop:2303 length:315 start_codon:yes stop_codon:yes gene_type:complete